jgi:hypothetical protein
MIDHASLTKIVTLQLLVGKNLLTEYIKYTSPAIVVFLNRHIKPNFLCRLTEPCCGIDAYVAVSLMGNSKLANTQYGRQSIPRNGTCYAFHVGQVRHR